MPSDEATAEERAWTEDVASFEASPGYKMVQECSIKGEGVVWGTRLAATINGALAAAASRARREALEEARDAACRACGWGWPLDDTGQNHVAEMVGPTHCYSCAIRDLITASDEASDGGTNTKENSR